MITVRNPTLDVFEIWSEKIKTIKNVSYSMEMSKIPSSFPYARLFPIGNQTFRSDLTGNECATVPAYQIDLFAKGKYALKNVYELDEVSHNAMVEMGFHRTYGPEPIENAENTIKRLVSRYSRTYCGEDLRM